MFQYEIIVDHGETPNKCTILPLSYRPDFAIRRGKVTKAFRSDILLHPEGESLAELNVAPENLGGLAAIDCIWRRLEPILNGIERPLPRLVRIPEGFVTAYPRASRKDFDPEGGLATIEAIFIAAAFVGRWDLSLLREYFFADKFLDLNESTFKQYGIQPDREGPVFQPLYPRNSATRRIGRGRVPRPVV